MLGLRKLTSHLPFLTKLLEDWSRVTWRQTQSWEARSAQESRGEVMLGRSGQQDRQQAALEQVSPTPRGPLTPVRNQAAQQEVSGRWASKASSAALHRSPSLALLPEPSPPPRPWKNCLPRNRSLVPKRLGTAALEQHKRDRRGTFRRNTENVHYHLKRRFTVHLKVNEL